MMRRNQQTTFTGPLRENARIHTTTKANNAKGGSVFLREYEKGQYPLQTSKLYTSNTHSYIHP